MSSSTICPCKAGLQTGWRFACLTYFIDGGLGAVIDVPQ